MKTNSNSAPPNLKSFLATSALAAALALAGTLHVHAAATYPSRVSSANLSQLPYKVTGIIWGSSLDPRYASMGSGTVAVDRRTAVSCAHVVFEDGTWLKNFGFAAAYNSSSLPSLATSGVALRGYKTVTGYNGGTSNYDYSRDLVVQYAYGSLAGGAFANLASDATEANLIAYKHPLQSDRKKLMIGYPVSDSHFMLSTGAFTSKFYLQVSHLSSLWSLSPSDRMYYAVTTSKDRFMWNGDVLIDQGMSGGGVFVDAGGGDYRLAGVNVAGRPDTSMGAGACALDTGTNALIASAISAAGTSKTVSSSTKLNIPDNSTAWTVRSLSISSMPTKILEVKVSVDITHTDRSDLEVTLTSPTGRPCTLSNRSGVSVANLVITGKDVTSSFSDTNPNGTWKLSVRDLATSDVGYLNSVSLTIAAR